jgi:hypothetical protein
VSGAGSSEDNDDAAKRFAKDKEVCSTEVRRGAWLRLRQRKTILLLLMEKLASHAMRRPKNKGRRGPASRSDDNDHDDGAQGPESLRAELQNGHAQTLTQRAW